MPLFFLPHSHPSIRALLDAEGGDDPFAAMRRRARSLVADALSLGWEGPPFNVTELASLRGLKVGLSSGLRADQDACVMPGQILVNARKHRVRQRYSIAHEVAHTLFPDYEDEVRRVGRLWRREGDDSAFERLCQAGGAELLMPLDAFNAAAEQRGRTLAGVLALAEDFDASLEAAVRRTVQTATEAMAAVFLRPRDAATGGWLEVERAEGHSPYAPLGVSLVYANAACGRFDLPWRSPPPRGGAADRAWKRVALARGTIVIERRNGESWTYLGIHGAWDSEAMTLPKAAAIPHEVLCLLGRRL